MRESFSKLSNGRITPGYQSQCKSFPRKRSVGVRRCLLVDKVAPYKGSLSMRGIFLKKVLEKEWFIKANNKGHT